MTQHLQRPLWVVMRHWLSLGNVQRKLGLRLAATNAAPEKTSHMLHDTSLSRLPSCPRLLRLPVSNLVSVCGSIQLA